MIRYLIDADLAIYAMGDAASLVNARIAECSPGEIAISAISFSEIALGVQLQKPPTPKVLAAVIAVIPARTVPSGDSFALRRTVHGSRVRDDPA